ncbi:MAG: 2-methylcitrate dehydratase [Rhizobiaceae bacterium]|jgi:2-methylcitrate dehydratase|nr:2-methylcitrate dehydratase [Rhizobiaceae bacterium]
MNDMSKIRQADILQDRMATFASELRFDTIPAEDVQAGKARIIDTFAATYAGFFSETARAARAYAASLPKADGATIIGTRQQTTPETAAFVNSATSREAEWNDVYMSRGAGGAHPSDVILPILAAAEYAGVDGREFLTAVVVAYEIYLGMSDVVTITGFDQTGLAGISVAAAAGRVLGLTPDQLRHAVSICTVANNPLNQTRRNQLSMWKAAAAGQAGRAGITAALMAKAGMEGPHLPFEGTAGWNQHIGRNKYEVNGLDPNSGPYRIRDSLIKPRASCAVTISSIFAAEAAAKKVRAPDVERVVVETYAYAKDGVGSGEQRWNPTSRETADHSIPYVVAAALADGSVGPRQFKEDRLWDPDLRALIQKVEVVANDAFSEAYDRHPREHHTRVTVHTRDGGTVVGLAGGADYEDMGKAKSLAEMEQKFKALSEDHLGSRGAREALDRMWRIDEIESVREIPPLFAM